MKRNKTVIIGGCHYDTILKLSCQTYMMRTNPATSKNILGGVAGNILRALMTLNRDVVFKEQAVDICLHFIGAVAKRDSRLKKELSEMGFGLSLIELESEPASYTAIIDRNGELVIGACEARLYDQITAKSVIKNIPSDVNHVILDANFPTQTLTGILNAVPERCDFFAAGTSVEKVERLAPILCKLDAIVLNFAEAKKLVGENRTTRQLAIDIVPMLRNKKGIALVSDGTKTAALATQNCVVTCLPPAFRAQNVNGAGDVMAGAFFHNLLTHKVSKTHSKAGLRRALSEILNLGASHARGNAILGARQIANV